jgi:hypothetical protein
MARQSAQLNIRSNFARQRVRELVEMTGMTATELVEDALRGYVPPIGVQPVGRLVERSGLLVMEDDGGPRISNAAAEAALDDARMRDLSDGG